MAKKNKDTQMTPMLSDEAINAEAISTNKNDNTDKRSNKQSNKQTIKQSNKQSNNQTNNQTNNHQLKQAIK